MNHLPVTWSWKAFAELTAAELYAALKLRSAVFVVEQACAFLDMDDCDQSCWHLLGWCGTELIAYLRLVPPGIKYAEASIGRVINATSVRGTGVGKQLFAEGVREAERRFPGQPLRIGAQSYLERFYGDFGFVRVGEPYMEDGILHLEMVREAKLPT